jgi:hypothetical protein
MIFDKICGIAERHGEPKLKKILKSAAVFKIYGMYKPRYTNDIFDSFTLPYPITAVEDEKICAIFIDRDENAMGIAEARDFAVFVPVNSVKNTYEQVLEGSTDSEEMEYFKKVMSNMIESNSFLSLYGFTVGGIETKLFDYGLVNKKGAVVLATQKDKLIEQLVESANKMLAKAMVNLMSLNSPDRFILKETPKKIKKPKKNRIKRTHERPLYTLLRPNEIREKIGLRSNVNTGKTKAPHERRRYWRFLSDEKYRFDRKGDIIEPKIIPFGPRRGELYYKKVDVPASWIGQSSKRTKNKIYRVVLDR